MGAQVIDADEIAKEQWNDPRVRLEATSRWGENFFSGEPKEVYAKIAAKIFSDEAEYKFASKLIHDATFREIKHILAGSHGWIVVEIPLLFESSRYDWLDYIVYVSAPSEKRAAINIVRGWDEKEIARRERWLMPRDIKMRLAGFVAENNGTLEEWEKKGRELGHFFMKKMKPTCLL